MPDVAKTYMPVKEFFLQLGYIGKQLSRFEAQGGVYAPCRFHGKADPKYHVEQLRLIQLVGWGVLTEEEANREWDEFRTRLATPREILLLREKQDKKRLPKAKAAQLAKQAERQAEREPAVVTREMLSDDWAERLANPPILRRRKQCRK